MHFRLEEKCQHALLDRSSNSLLMFCCSAPCARDADDAAAIAWQACLCPIEPVELHAARPSTTQMC
eukprot:6400223-Amphidinium_carterae.1